MDTNRIWRIWQVESVLFLLNWNWFRTKQAGKCKQTFNQIKSNINQIPQSTLLNILASSIEMSKNIITFTNQQFKYTVNRKMLCISVKLTFADLTGISLTTCIVQNQTQFWNLGWCPWQYDKQQRIRDYSWLSFRQLCLAPFHKAQWWRQSPWTEYVMSKKQKKHLCLRISNITKRHRYRQCGWL